jgi:acetyl esterase/lipase
MGFLMSGSGVVGGYMSGGKQWPDVLAQTEESENCLILNVVTPNLKGRRPVIVYIHGGGHANRDCRRFLPAPTRARTTSYWWASTTV